VFRKKYINFVAIVLYSSGKPFNVIFISL